jgi:dihydroorotase
MGLSGVPVAAETIALHTIFELVRATGARVHICRLSSAAGAQLLRQAKAEGLPVTGDVSVNSLHLTDMDVGYFDSRTRLNPPLRQQRDRDALRMALQDGTIDALVSDHMPVGADEKELPFAEAEPGATGLELLLSLAVKWARDSDLPLVQALACVTQRSAAVLAASQGTAQGGMGRLEVGAKADICVFDPQAAWTVQASALRSQSKHTPFGGYELPGQVRATLVAGRLAFQAPGTGPH